jgi:hypothetical protein
MLSFTKDLFAFVALCTFTGVAFTWMDALSRLV